MQQTKKFQEVKKINDTAYQQVQNLFHRNRMFMMKHNIVPHKGVKVHSKKKKISGDLTYESLQKLRNMNKSLHINIGDHAYGANSTFDKNQNESKSFLHQDESSQDLYSQKLHELLSTQESFSKHFVSSDQRMNKQIQIDCDKQKQRLMYGAINMSKTLQSSKNNKSKNGIYNRNSFQDQFGSHSFYQEKDNTYSQNLIENQNTLHNYYSNQEQQGHSIQFEFDKPKQNGIHQDSILYPKSPSVNFDQYSQRKDLFKASKTDTNSNEYRFNNFFMQRPDNQHTIDIKKQTNRKYEVFDCQMSEIKYDNVCEIYQKNTFNNLLTKCLVDYNREGKETERVYYPVQKDIPQTDLEVENIINGKSITSPFKRTHSPNIKKYLGREKKINFYPNSVLCQPTNANAGKENKNSNNNRRYNSAQRGQTQQLQIQTSGANLHQNLMFNRPQTSKRSDSINQRSDSKQERNKRVNTAHDNNNETSQQIKQFVNKRNPLSLFREKRRKIHEMLNIDD